MYFLFNIKDPPALKESIACMVIANRSKNIQHFKSKLYRLRDKSVIKKKLSLLHPRLPCHDLSVTN